MISVYKDFIFVLFRLFIGAVFLFDVHFYVFVRKGLKGGKLLFLD